MSDLISRQQAIEIIQSMYPGMPRVPWMRKDWQKRYEPYIRTENAIRELPSIRPKGKWIEYPTVDGMNQCSECGVLRFGESNYCPNCGADNMQEVKKMSAQELYNTLQTLLSEEKKKLETLEKWKGFSDYLLGRLASLQELEKLLDKLDPEIFPDLGEDEK